MYKIGDKYIWNPINRATDEIDFDNYHCGKTVTVIGDETLDRVRISVDDFLECNNRRGKNQFVASKDELKPVNNAQLN